LTLYAEPELETVKVKKAQLKDFALKYQPVSTSFKGSYLYRNLDVQNTFHYAF